MPIFEFQCDVCGDVVERLMSYLDLNEIEGKRCGGCNDGHYHRKHSSFGLRFVGKDFYVTESRAAKERERLSTAEREAKKNIKAGEK